MGDVPFDDIGSSRAAPPVPSTPPPGNPPPLPKSTPPQIWDLEADSSYASTRPFSFAGADFDDEEDTSESICGRLKGKDPCLQVLVILLVLLFIITSIFSGTFMLKMIVFEGDYFSVYDTIDERVNNLTELFLAEEALFPNIPEIEEREGHCNDTYALNLVAGFSDTYDAGIDSAKMQILWVGCNTSHNDAPSMHGLADFCADLNASLVDLNNLPDHEDTNFTTPTNTPPPSSEVQSDFENRAEARYEYDKNYVLDHILWSDDILGFNTGFNFQVQQVNLSVGDIGAFADASIPSTEILTPIFGVLNVANPSYTTPIINMLDDFETLKFKADQLQIYVDDMHLQMETHLETKITGIPPDVLPELGLGGSDYNPPEVIDGSLLNRTLAGLAITAPDVDLTDSTTYNASFVDRPDNLPSIPIPEINFALNFFVVLDSIWLICDVLFVLLRFRFRAPPAVKVTRNFGRPRYEGAFDWKDKSRKCLGWTVARFKFTYLYMLLGVVLYVVLIYLYAHMLYKPVHDDNSYVYTQEGWVSYRNDLWDFLNYNHWNSELTRINNQCVKEQNELATMVSNKESELSLNLTNLGYWAESEWDRMYDLDNYPYDASDTTYVKANKSELCTCIHREWNPSYEAQRRNTALNADVQLYKVMDSYVLKLHFFVFLLVGLRVARAIILSAIILILSIFTVPIIEAKVRMPANQTTTLTRGIKAAGNDSMYANHIDFSKELEEYNKARQSKIMKKMIIVFVIYLFCMVALFWNGYVNRFLASDPDNSSFETDNGAN